MTRLKPKSSTLRAIWGRSAERCNICKQPLVKEMSDGNLYTTFGKIAHITAAEEGGARYDASLSDNQRRSHINLMLLCGPHHDEVDTDEAKYTAEFLRKTKADHEAWVTAQLSTEMANIGYPDLEVIMTFLGENAESDYVQDYSLLEIKTKIEKNEMSQATERLIQMGLTQSSTINAYLNDFPDPQYAERLRNIFVETYLSLREQKESSDELYYALVDAIKGPSTDIKRFATAIALVTYFFERCDIFEK